MINENQKNNEPGVDVSDILGALREAILVVGESMTVLSSNSAAERSFSNSGEDLSSKRLSEVLRDFSLHKAVKKALLGVETEVRIELIGDIPRVYDVVVSPANMTNENAAIAVFYEVTNVLNLERVRQEFLSNISHELRTPLTSILAFVETLEDGAIDDQGNNKRFLEVIRKNAERMHLLIDDISELSMIEAGETSIEREQVELRNLVSEIFQNFSKVAAERKIGLINEVAESTYVTADSARLHQMLANLVDNAIKFNRFSGTVTVSHSINENDEIRVADAGEGMLREHQQRIFERFYRIDKARSREVGGTGLGLAIVKHLARLHGGEVSVTSVASEGTTFCLHLPRTATKPVNPVI